MTSDATRRNNRDPPVSAPRGALQKLDRPAVDIELLAQRQAPRAMQGILSREWTVRIRLTAQARGSSSKLNHYVEWYVLHGVQV